VKRSCEIGGVNGSCEMGAVNGRCKKGVNPMIILYNTHMACSSLSGAKRNRVIRLCSAGMILDE